MREVSRKRASAKSDRKEDYVEDTVKADKRGTMLMVTIIFGHFVALESRVAQVLNIAAYLSDYFIVEKSRAEYVSPGPLGVGPVTFEKLPHLTFLPPSGW